MILVTGGAGFIGSNIVARLSEAGRAVAVCDRLRSDGKWQNLAKADLCDVVAPEALEGWLEAHRDQVERVVHMGAISSTTATDGDLVFDVNFRLSWSLWRWCARHGKPFIYASSAATYGGGEQGFDDGLDGAALGMLRPLNLYGWTKHAFDRRVARAVAAGEPRPPQWAGLKFFNVYGPNEYHKGSMKSVIAHWYQDAKAGRPLRLFKSYLAGCADGAQQRDFVYVGDCVDVVEWLIATPTVNGVYNLGTGTARTFHDVAQALFAAVGQTPRIEFVDMPEQIRPRYQYFTQAKVERLRAAGYRKPFHTVEQGVRDYVERFLSRPDIFR